MSKSLMLFKHEGKEYEVNNVQPDKCDKIVLPNGTILQMTSILHTDPPIINVTRSGAKEKGTAKEIARRLHAPLARLCKLQGVLKGCDEE